MLHQSGGLCCLTWLLGTKVFGRRVLAHRGRRTRISDSSPTLVGAKGDKYGVPNEFMEAMWINITIMPIIIPKYPRKPAIISIGNLASRKDIPTE